MIKEKKCNTCGETHEKDILTQALRPIKLVTGKCFNCTALEEGWYPNYRNRKREPFDEH